MCILASCLGGVIRWMEEDEYGLISTEELSYINLIPRLWMPHNDDWTDDLRPSEKFRTFLARTLKNSS